ncbi:MAG: 4-hydroxy-tetrahydrodipicolinate reductase [Candidatus Poribacteria bacterium]|nr:4-hydroxy-tetrahydrodipicolinate reductase [Candidatus Poribacteria bacterium]MDE0503772.1 4-hydroxy-tetrahydrodipicolinate reductase [Candidatus Poribacteria bacterium]
MISVIIDGACGRMGKMISQGVVTQNDMQLVGAIEYHGHPQLGEDVGEVAGVGTVGVPISDDLPEILDDADVVIEFTAPSASIEHLRDVVGAGKTMVLATTGFTEAELAEVHELAKEIPFVMAPNMSVGVNVMLQAIQLVAKALGDDYDVEVIEAHHNQKADSPSGTALRIAEVLAESLDRNLANVGVYGRHGMVGARQEKEIGIHAIRGGDISGDHTVLYAGSGERIEITHRAHTREAFAKGAIRAARWVVNAPKGLHDISEVLF